MSSGRRVALALGSGGARGYAHLGALEVLRERDYEIVSIAGSSMGALVGALAAVGADAEFATWASGLGQRDVLRLLDPVLSAPGVIRAEKVLARVGEMVGDVEIEDLPIPYTAVATDLDHRREVWFQRGPLMAAVRASIALPGAITPVVVNGRLLVDGGLVNPVPIEPTRAADSDLTIAISLLGPRSVGAGSSPVRASAAPRPYEEWASKLRRSLAARWQPVDPQAPAEDVVEHAATAGLPKVGLMEVVTRSVETTSELIARFRMAANPPDVLVTVPTDVCGTLEFHRAAETIAVGRALMTQALDRAAD